MKLTLGGKRYKTVKITDENVNELLAGLQGKLEGKEAKIKSLQDELGEATRQLKKGLSEIKALENQLDEASARDEERNAAESALHSEIRSLQAEIEEYKRGHRANLHRITTAGDNLKQCKNALEEAKQTIAILEEKLPQVEKYVAPYNRLQAAHDELQTTYERACDQVEKYKRIYKDQYKQLKKVHAAHSATIEELREVKTELGEAVDYIKNIKRTK